MWLWRKYRSQAAGLLVMAMLFCSVLPSGVRANDTLPARLTEEQIIGEGVVLQTYIKKVGGKDVILTVTKVDLNNPYAEVRPIYGKGGTFAEKQTITEMAKETGAIAAINSDFFTLKNRTPFGIALDKGELVSSMGRMPYWVSLGITNDRTAIIERFTYQGKVTAPNGSTYVIQGVNKEEYQSAGYASHRDQVNLYTPAFGPTSLGLLAGYEDYVEVVVENDIVKEIRIKQPAASIPRNGYVLWGHGGGGKFLQEAFKVGDPVQVSSSTLTSTNGLVLDSAMAGHILLVDNGTALAPSVSSIRGTVARSAAGITQDGKTLLLVAVESSSKSRGMELAELAQLMKELGSYRAFNLDGGGSTTMAARKLADTEISLLNQPQGGTQRKVPTGIGIFNTAPKGDFKGFLIEGPAQVLKGNEAVFRVRGYDIHYHPFAVPQQEVVWTGLDVLSPGVQEVKGEYRGFSLTRQIEVIGASKVSQILVEPSVLTVNKGQARTFTVKVQTKDGKIVDATPRGVATSLSTDTLGTVSGFTFTAGQEEGRGELVVNFDGIEKRIPVNVGTLPQAFESFDALTGLSYSALPNTLAAKGSFTLVEDQVYRTKKAARLTYNFAGAPQTEIRFAYGLLGAKPLAMPGTPLSAGLWVYGDNSKHWLRSELVDAKGTTHYLDWAKEIDFSGWKYLMASIPSAVTYPVSIKSVYVVNTPEGTAQRPESGTLYFDELTLYQPYDPSKDTKPNDVIAQQGVRLAGEVEIKLDGAARIEPVSTIPLQIKGYKPSLQGFRLSGNVQQPQTVAMSALNGSQMGLLYLDESQNTWVEVKGTRLASGENLFPLQGWGMYIPYYSQAAVNPFKDVKSGTWYEKAVVELYQQGIVNGLSKDQFGPNAVLTRAQFVTLLGNWLGWKDDPTLKLDFKDSIPGYAVPAVKVAVSKGIVQGFPGGLFKSDAPLTRAQMSVMLYNALQDKGADLSGGEGVTFVDRAAIPGWASEAVQTMAGKGYIKGMNGSFKPQDTATRAQAASLIYQLNQ
ncbi:phosphodiester glycosidase family protein [Ammoniphilus sp. YIM 78166]|uniref:phosphodiester glycosidase family protein n=1 Tax=Ammoniphilus sp. YIM 78166 TaxID=1644106 RepID=UPI00106FD20D|nr:phosphodiester glycosidase family protein [Ammoniphilus sp. YIM 78166]